MLGLFPTPPARAAELPAAAVTGLEKILALPPWVYAGDEVMAKVLDYARTPLGGKWTIAGAAAREVPEATGPGRSLRVRIPENLRAGDRVAVTYTDPKGRRTLDVPSAATCRGAPPPAADRPRFSSSAPMAFAGETVCVCGWFPTDAVREGLTLNGKPAGTPAGASGGIVLVRIPPDTPPGPARIAGAASAGFGEADQAAFTVLRLGGEIDRNRLRSGQNTTARLWIEGTKQPLALHIRNETPSVIGLEGGNDQVVTTDGKTPNGLTRTVYAIHPGDFNITYGLTTDPCPCTGETVSKGTKETTVTPVTPVTPPRETPVSPSTSSGSPPSTGKTVEAKPTPVVHPTPTPLPASTTDTTKSPKPGDGLKFRVVVTNPTDKPVKATVHDPVPPGCSHVDPKTVTVGGSSTPPVNGTTEGGGVHVTDVTVPAHGQVTVTYTVYVAEGVTDGTTITNTARVNDTPSNPAGPPPVSNPQVPTGLTVEKRYDGPAPPVTPRGPGTTTTTRETPTHPGTTSRPTPEEPTPHTPEEHPRMKKPCDACCYTTLEWSKGPAIAADIVVPAADSVEVPLGGQLPLAAEGFDYDLLTIHCELTGCGDKPCPPCTSLAILQMASPLEFHWQIASGAGGLVTRPHPHSNESHTSAAVFQAPDEMPADPKTVVELTVSDGPQKLWSVRDDPVTKRLTIKLVQPPGAPPPLGPKQLPAGSTITPSTQSCPCRPHWTWTGGEGIKVASFAIPRYVCEKGYAVLSAPGTDADHLTAGCAGGCSTHAADAQMDLADALVYKWSATKGSVLGGMREQVVYKPGGVGDAQVKLDVADSGTQFADPPLHFEGPITVVGIDPSDTGDYIVPFSKENIIRYVIKPATLSADSVALDVFDTGHKLIRHIEGLPTANEAAPKGYAEFKWDGLTDFGTPLTEKGSPYTYRLTMVKGDARCRLEITDRKVKEWDYRYNIPDRGPVPNTGTPAGVSGIDVKTVVPTLVETFVTPAGGAEVKVPVYVVEGQKVNANEQRARVTLMRSFAASDKFLLYTSPTAPNTIGYTMRIHSNPGGALDVAGNEWDMDPATKDVVERTQIWTFVIDENGKLTKFAQAVKN